MIATGLEFLEYDDTLLTHEHEIKIEKARYTSWSVVCLITSFCQTNTNKYELKLYVLKEFYILKVKTNSRINKLSYQ